MPTVSGELTKLTLRVDGVQPMDCVDVFCGRYVRTVSHGTYTFPASFGRPQVAAGVELEVGLLRVETEWASIGDARMLLTKPVWTDLELTRYRYDTVVQVIRGMDPRTLEPSPAEVAAAAAAQESMEAELRRRQ